MGDYLLANLTQAVSVYCESIAVEIYPKSGHTMVGQTRSRRTDVPEGRSRRGYLWLRCDELRIGRWLFAPRTWTSDNYGKMCGAQKVWILPCCRKPTPGMGGLRGRLRVVYYHFRETGTFPTPSQCSGGSMLFRQVKISCCATKGNGRRQGGGGHKRTGRKESMDAVQGGGFLSERGWRSGRELPEKEKWFNYASGGE